MTTKLAHVTIIVRDQEEALRFYTEKLGFEKRMDGEAGPGMRFLTVAPAGQQEVEIVLWAPGRWVDEATAKTMLERVGQGTSWVFNTDDCRETHETWSARGVHFTSSPEDVPWGVQAQFQDLYGNNFVLLEPRMPAPQ